MRRRCEDVFATCNDFWSANLELDAKPEASGKSFQKCGKILVKLLLGYSQFKIEAGRSERVRIWSIPDRS